MKIQNLVVDLKSEPVKSNSEQYQFLFKYVSSENKWQNFENYQKKLFCGHHSTTGIFPKNSG